MTALADLLTIDVEEAQRQISKLVDMAAHGQPFVISENGIPMVKVSAVVPEDLAEALS